jgi:hypothetical protein
MAKSTNQKNKLSVEFLKKVMQLGTLGYPLSKCINVLEDGFDVEQFKKDFYDETSEIFLSYQKGADKADFLIDNKLFEKARAGDLKALEKYELRKRGYKRQHNAEKKDT